MTVLARSEEYIDIGTKGSTNSLPSWVSGSTGVTTGGSIFTTTRVSEALASSEFWNSVAASF